MKDVASRRYNILYTTSFGHMMGGGQWSLYYLVTYLNKEIFHPIVVCPGEGELAEKMRRAGAEVIYLDVGRIRYLNPLVLYKFITIMKERKIDFVHTDSPTETLYAGIAAKIMRIPLVWHIRVSEKEWFFDRILSLLSSRLILVANAIKRRFPWLKDTYKLVVVYNGIDLKEFDTFQVYSSIREEFNIDKDTVLLGCIGRIERRKGQEYILSAMRNLDNVKLILVGSVEKESFTRITMLCNEFNIADRVISTGHRDDIPSVLREIDIFVFPTISGEGFPRVILEAMAAGKPVVATDNAGNPEAVEHGITGYIVPTGNSAVLAMKLEELVADKKKRAGMGQAGRKRVEKFFTIQKNVKRIQEVYFNIIEKNKIYSDLPHERSA